MQKQIGITIFLTTLIWIGLTFQIQAQTPDWQTVETPFEHAGQVLEDSNGTMWITSWTGNANGTVVLGQGVAQFTAAGWVIYTVESTQGDLPGDSIHSAAFDQADNLWLAVAENQPDNSDSVLLDAGLVRFNPVDQTWQTFNQANTDGALASDSVRDIIVDDMGRLWVATLDGISHYDGDTWQLVATSAELNNGSPFRLFLDRQQRLWVSLVDEEDGSPQGVRYADLPTDSRSQNLTFRPLSTFADQFVLSMAEDWTQNLWFGTVQGLTVVGPDLQPIVLPKGQNLAGEAINQLLQGYDNQMWAATSQGLQQFDGQTWQVFGDGNPVVQMFKDSEGLVWLSSPTPNMQLYQGYHQQTFGSSNGDFNHDFIWHLFEASDGSVWLGTLQTGVSRYQTGTWETFNQESDALPHNTIEAMLEASDGSVWIGTPAGVSRYQDGTWQLFNQTDGDLLSDATCSLAEDTAGDIFVFHWFSDDSNISTCTGGVSRYRNGRWQTFDQEAYQTLTIKESRRSINNVQTEFVDRDGFTWQKGNTDLRRFRPGLRPPAVKTSVLATPYNQPLTSSLISLGYHDRPYFSFGLTGFDFATMPEQLQYRYQVPTSPAYAEWQTIGYGQPFVLSQLTTGSHQLTVQVVDGDGNASEVVTLDLQVAEPVLPVPQLVNSLILPYAHRQNIAINFEIDDGGRHPLTTELQYLYQFDDTSEEMWQTVSHNQSILIPELDAGKYTLQLKAVDGEGNESDTSQMSLTIEEPPTATPKPATATATPKPATATPKPTINSPIATPQSTVQSTESVEPVEPAESIEPAEPASEDNNLWLLGLLAIVLIIGGGVVWWQKQ
ncbi:two-component regulator propeller domain-containing protein [Anaerolineales bacterium HSG6]|nr:two-component regulator propeller domain-containing protein [Anaerolineales bacterium HSG6]